MRTHVSERGMLEFGEPVREGVLSWNTFSERGEIALRLLRAQTPASPWLKYAQWSPEGRRSF